MDVYQILVSCDAIYKSPMDKNGKLLGPLVAYAGRDSIGQNLVGFFYANLARAEQNHLVRRQLAKIMAHLIRMRVGNPTTIIAAPMGGLILGTTTANSLECGMAFFEKEVTELQGIGIHLTKKSRLILQRHDLRRGDKVIIFEDVCNNFSTSDKMIALLKLTGVEILAIACIVNRSTNCEWKGIPVISALHIPSLQYCQTDPIVASLIKAGNIVWNPKQKWDQLMLAMKNGSL